MISLVTWTAFSLFVGIFPTFPSASGANSSDYAFAAIREEFRFGDVTFMSDWRGRVALVSETIQGDSSLWYPKASVILPKRDCPVEIGWVHTRPARPTGETPTATYDVRVKISFPIPGDSLLVTALANVGQVTAVTEVDSVMRHAFQFLAPAEVDSLRILCYQHPASIKELMKLPVNTKPDPAMRRMLRSSDLDPDDYKRVEGLNSSMLSEALLRDSRISTLVIYRRSRIFVSEYAQLSETLGISLVSLSVEYLDESYPDTLRSYENVHLSLAIDDSTKRVYILTATYRSEPRKNLFPRSDTEQFLYLMKQAGYSSIQMSEALETRLLRYLIVPHRGLVLSTRDDTCMYRRSLEDESFLDLIESDSVLGVEAGEGLLGPNITPNLFEVWRQLYGFDCSQDTVAGPKQELTKYKWKVWYRDDGQIEQFELVESKEGHPQLVRTILPTGD